MKRSIDIAVKSCAALAMLFLAGLPAKADYRPSIKIGTAALVSPADAATYYGSSTVHSIGPGAPTATPPEIVALSRALKGDPDLIYAYVHDNIQMVWMYGLQKGALGALIDKAGTPFDQAALLVELLRAASPAITAQYQSGTVTLTGAQFLDWTGISDATAACQLLSSGGIPAAINGSTLADCSYGTGTAITSVTVAHIWVSATIGGTAYRFDPSFKGHSWKPQIDLATATGITGPGNDPLAAATSGMITGDTGTTPDVHYVQALNQVNLNGKLGGYASNLLTYMRGHSIGGSTLASLHMQDIVGGGIITPTPPNSPVRVTAPACGGAVLCWDQVPDKYRTTLQLSASTEIYVAQGSCTDINQYCPMFSATFFVDEVYGRVMMIDTDIEDMSYGTSLNPSNTMTLKVDGQAVLDASGHPLTFTNPSPGLDTTRAAPAKITLTADHPYAAAGGTYMDTTVTKPAMIATPVIIVHGWGDTGPGLLSKWTEETASDQPLPAYQIPNPDTDVDADKYLLKTANGGQGDFDREKLAAGWLAQTSAAAHLNADIANAVPQMHHEIGLAYAVVDFGLIPLDPHHVPPTYSMPLSDSYTKLDIDSGISLTSKTADRAARNAGVQTFAAASAALESSIVAQTDNLPDTSSTATRFEWGNLPPGLPGSTDANAAYDPAPLVGGTRQRKFMAFDSTNASAAAGVVVAENQTTGGPGTFQALTSGEIYDYAHNGLFKVIASGETYLGPGQRLGLWHPDLLTYDITRQRGGAFVATRYADSNDPNSDPVEIAHIVTSTGPEDHSGAIVLKGGGGGTQPTQAATYNPKDAADILKTKFVDRSNLLGVDLATGSVAYESPASLKVGNGDFPYSFSAGLSWFPGTRPTDAIGGPPVTTAPQPGSWTSNWQNSLALSGGGMQAMGQSDVRAAVNTIAAFLGLQSIYKNTQSTERDVSGVLAAAWWTHRLEANVATVQKGKSSRQLVNAAGSEWIAPGTGETASLTIGGTSGQRVQFENTCATDGQPALTRGWNVSGLAFTVNNAHGDTEHYDYWLNNYNTDGSDTGACGRLEGFRLTHWDFPQGIGSTPLRIDLTYGNPYNYHDPITARLERLVSVKNTLGWEVDFAWGGGSDPTHLASFTDGHRTVSLDWPGVSDFPVGHVDPEVKETKFLYRPAQSWSATQRPLPYALLDQVFTADNLTQANVDYDYDGVNRVMTVKDGVAIQKGTRGPYQFFLADGTRGERDDPLGQAYSVVYDTFGHPSRYVDEMGHETDVTTDGRGRTLTTLYPELDCEAFAYDEANNTTDFWKIDSASSCNTGAGSSHVLHASAVWDMTWNKPLTVTNARGFTTTLEYYGATEQGASLLKKATRPTIDEGTPVYSFTYTPIGLLDTAMTPATSGTNIVTQNTYDTAANHYNLLSTIVDPGTGSHLHLMTAFVTDATGDVTSTTDPRGNVTTSLYDNNRRKTEDDHHDGDASHALIAASRTQYDEVGRDKENDAGTMFSGTTVSTWQTMKTTTYTPTSKVDTVTDADGRVTNNTWDDGDRLLTVADPIGRKTHFVYCGSADIDCAANQVKKELRAWGSGGACFVSGTLQQCYRQPTYYADGEIKSVKDANGNMTTYAYDDWKRLTTTSFPDGSYERLTLDENGNVTQRLNRAGQTLNYIYNALDWIKQKTLPSPSPAAYWTYRLNGQIDTLCDVLACGTPGNIIDYGYDGAGRMNQVVTRLNGFGSNRTVNYTLDADGNRTKLQWPSTDGAYYVGYCYDNLNRMTVATENATDCTSSKLATYSYDALSRRTLVTYGNGASMSYPSYSNAGDLLTLNHDLSGTANDNSFTYTYTNAHQLWTETSSLAAWQWQPSSNGTDNYHAANNLNQYPSITPQGAPSARTLGYDANGNLTSGNIDGSGVWTFGYDAENRMLTACKPSPCTSPTVNATYAYDPLGRRNKKSGTGVTTTYYLSDGTDEIAEYDSTKTLTTRYIPGPAIDEPIAVETVSTGAHAYFHTNRQGSVVAISDDTGAKVEGPYNYDAYGNCFVGGSPCSSTGEPYRFTGRRFDAETGLYYYRARYYTSALGRFLQTDPVGYDADLNLYTYVGNDPTDKTDPSGNDAVDYLAEHDPNFGGSMNYQPPNAVDTLNDIADMLDTASAIAASFPDSRIAAPELEEGAVGLRSVASGLKAESTIARNAAQGAKGEAATEAKLGDKVAGKQVTFKASDNSRSRADFVTTDKGVVETKTGGGDLSKGQKALHADIKAGRPVTPVGNNAAKAGLEPGKPTVMKYCQVDRPC